MTVEFHFLLPHDAALLDPFEGHGASFFCPDRFDVRHLEHVLRLAAGRAGRLQVMIPAGNPAPPAARPGWPDPRIWLAPFRDPETLEWDPDLTQEEVAAVRLAAGGYVPDPDFGKSVEEQTFRVLVRLLRSGQVLGPAEVSEVLCWLTRDH